MVIEAYIARSNMTLFLLVITNEYLKNKKNQNQNVKKVERCIVEKHTAMILK